MYPHGRVTVTPLSIKPSQKEVAASVTVPGVKKVLLKAVNKENGKDSKLFTLRNIQQMYTTSCENLKKKLLCDDIVDGSFDVGVMQSNLAVHYYIMV